MRRDGYIGTDANGAFILTDRGLPDKAFELIAAEDKVQLEKWGTQQHGIFEWLAIISEELGELSKGILEFWFRDGDLLEDVEKEAIQVATLALKMAWMIKQEREGRQRS